ncbi:MAG: glycosyltransferase 61 family protein, partial [Clostridia bacterium]
MGANELSDFDNLNNNFGANNHLKPFLCFKDNPKILNLEMDEKNVIDSIINKTYIKADDVPYIHTFHFFNIYVWGHLWDSLNNLEDFEGSNIDFRLAVSQITSHVRDLLLHFDILGYNQSKITSFPWTGHPYKFPNLYVSNIWSEACYIRNKAWIEKKYINENSHLNESLDELRSKKYKLYLSRSEYGKNRKTLNEDLVWKILEGKGYIKLNGEEGLIKHIKYFMGAEKIIYTHGSMIKNTAFCLNRDVEIWEFYPLGRMNNKHFPKYGCDNVFQRLNKNMGLNKHFFLPIESDKDQNVILDLELIDRIS